MKPITPITPPTEYPNNIVHNFYFQELLPAFDKQIWQEEDPQARYEGLNSLLQDCWAIDLLENSSSMINDRDEWMELISACWLRDWGLTWARLVATAFRSGKLHGHNAFDLLGYFKRLVIDYEIKAESVWDCYGGFKHPDGTDITEIGDFFEEALVEATDSEKKE